MSQMRRLKEDCTTGLLDTKNVDDLQNILSFEDREKEKQRTKDFIKKRYPNADISKLKIIFFQKKTPMDIVVLGTGDGETKIIKADGSGFRSDFLNKKNR